MSKTGDRRRMALQEDALKQAALQYRKDAAHLLKDPAFHRWLAVEWFGHLGYGSDPCRSSAFEAQRAAARVGVVVEQRRRLMQFDHAGVRAIDEAHHDQVARELGLEQALDEQPNEQEQDDA